MSNRKQCLILSIVGLVTVYILVICSILGCGQPVVYNTQPIVTTAPPQLQVSQPQYEIIQDPNSGVQYSVFYDNGIQQMVELSLFNSWMGMGGYGYVIHHYHDNPSYYRRYDSRVYRSYSRVPRNSPAYSPAFRSSTTPSVRANNTPASRSGPSPTVRSTPTPQFRSTPSAMPTRSSPPVFRSASSSSSRSTPQFKSSSTRH